MKIQTPKILALLLFCLSISYGERAPDFTLPDLNGKQISLQEMRGKIVVIDFWATWCKACREAFPKLNEIASKHGEMIEVVGINLEKIKPEKVISFANKAKIEYTILLDPEMKTAKPFSIRGVPSVIVIDRDGNIVKSFRGMDRNVEKEIGNLLDSLTTEITPNE